MLDLPRHADANRVREHELVGLRLHELIREAEDVAGIDGALERAAEGNPDRHRGADAVGVGAGDDVLCNLDRLLRRRVLVPAIEVLRGREREVNLIESRLRQAVVAAFVQREPGVDDALSPVDPGDDLLGARHLRHARGVDEADRLDPRQARRCKSIDEVGARLGIELRRLVLEAVARADVADDDAHTTPSSFSRASSSSERPRRPPYTSRLWLPSSHVADQRTSHGVSENFGTMPGPRYGPNSGSVCSTSMSRARNCSSSKMSA